MRIEVQVDIQVGWEAELQRPASVEQMPPDGVRTVKTHLRGTPEYVSREIVELIGRMGAEVRGDAR